ncbi:DNA-dependent RNA polymerase II, partial [Coemansia sp. RSA 2607]
MADNDYYYESDLQFEGTGAAAEYGDEVVDGPEVITQEDCWTLISRYFDEHGLVRQQIESFNSFIEETLQEIVDESRTLVMETTFQGRQGQEMKRRYHIQFGQVYMSTPSFVEKDGSMAPLYPQEARLRNLTYSSPLLLQYGQKTLVADTSIEVNRNVTSVADMVMEVVDDQ